MATVRIGHGADQVRDIGPAAASGVSGLDAVGRLSAVRGSDSGSLEPAERAVGAGPVERRKATPEELARLADEGREAIAEARRPTYTPSAEDRDRAAASRRRGQQRLQEQREASRPAQGSAGGSGTGPVVGTPARTEAPPTTEAELRQDVLRALGHVAVPCGDCLHAPVCALKAMLEDLGPLEPVQVIDRGLRAVATSYRIDCDHHLAAVPVPTPVAAPSVRRSEPTVRRSRPATRGENNRVLPRDPAERRRVVLAAVAETRSTAEAGLRLGVSAARIQQLLRDLRTTGQLPTELELLLTTRGNGGRGMTLAEHQKEATA